MNNSVIVGPKDRIFIVEDNCERILWFQRQLGDRIVGISARGPMQAIELLEMFDPNTLDLIFLDHDLGIFHEDTISGRPVEETAYPVAQWLAYNAGPKIGLRVIIHSYNESGAKRMQQMLPGSVYLPFGSFKIVERP